MKWLTWSLLGWLFSGSSVLFLRNVGKRISSSLELQIIYLLVTFILIGVISIPILLIILSTKRDYIKDIKNLNKWNLILTAISILGAYIFIKLATNKGGSPAFQIINLNIILIVIGSYILFNERLNPVQLGGIILSIISAGIIGSGDVIWNIIKKN